MRVLVTGAFGYVGRAVTRRLVEAGHEVVALSSGSRGCSDEDRAFVHSVVVADLGERLGLDTAVAGVDAVCHLAALTGVRESFKRPNEYRAINTESTAALLDAAAGEGLRTGRPLRFVQASTAAVYGTPAKQPIDEDAVPDPTSPYGASKLAADEAVRECAAAGRIAAVSLRAFNVAGSVGGHGDPGRTRIIPKTLRVAAGLEPQLRINGDGSAVRDFVHVDDLARAYLLALDACRVGEYRCYNVGATGAGVREIVATAEAVTGWAVPVVHDPPQPEPPVLLADTRRIRAELGWSPRRSSLTELVSDTWTDLLESLCS
jgi:UDP-glucose 4-epimerase